MQRALFLDRDGVINVSPRSRFITDWKQFQFCKGTLQALRMIRRHGFRVIIISNQSGVGRGIMSRTQLTEITDKMKKTIQQAGGKLDAVYYCTHRPKEGCSCRKPAVGLLKRAAQKFSINLTRSFIVGDDERDIVMGHRAGCRTILALSGKQTRKTAKRLAIPPDRISRNLLEAVRWIVRQ